MISKVRVAGSLAIAASLFVTLASAEGSGAFAQPGENPQIDDQPLTEEKVPVFVAREVVQPLPEKDAAAPDTSDQNGSVRAESLSELVSETRTSDTLSQEMHCLAGAVYFESRGEPLEGQLAVAQVIINRADSGIFPSSYCGVVTQRSQFSFVKNGRMPSPRTGGIAWRNAKAIARIAHEGLWDSTADDSLYFHAKYVKPGWSRRKVALTTISSHVFYK